MSNWKEKIEAAHDMVSALCKPRGSEGSREWIMSIPARPDYDPDLVITDGLIAAKKRIAELEASLRAATETRSVGVVGWDVDPDEAYNHWCKMPIKERGTSPYQVIEWSIKYLAAHAAHAAHAVLPVPQGVPPLEELVAIGSDARMSDRGGNGPLSHVRAAAIRDAVLAGLAPAAPETLEALAEIGRKAYNEEHYKACREIDAGSPVDRKSVIKRSLLTQVTAILHAAQPYLDMTPAELTEWANSRMTREAVFERMNSRIRYRVAVPPETPKGLPSAEEFCHIVVRQYEIWHGVPNWNSSEPLCRHWEKSFEIYFRAILTALRPWLREPTGWELEVLESELHDVWRNHPNGYAAILDLCRSRIRPVYECKECGKLIKKFEGMQQEQIEMNDKILAALDKAIPARAAFEWFVNPETPNP